MGSPSHDVYEYMSCTIGYLVSIMGFRSIHIACVYGVLWLTRPIMQSPSNNHHVPRTEGCFRFHQHVRTFQAIVAPGYQISKIYATDTRRYSKTEIKSIRTCLVPPHNRWGRYGVFVTPLPCKTYNQYSLSPQQLPDIKQGYPSTALKKP